MFTLRGDNQINLARILHNKIQAGNTYQVQWNPDLVFLSSDTHKAVRCWGSHIFWTVRWQMGVRLSSYAPTALCPAPQEDSWSVRDQVNPTGPSCDFEE
jgi:hypothetical protein